MGVYNLKNPQDLENDLNDILNRINQIYSIKYTEEQIQIVPKLSDTSNAFWASEENTKKFNTHIPNFKNLHTYMYAFVEATARLKEGEYNISFFESKYPNYKEFRLLNNMIKHPKAKEVEISFTKIVHIVPKQFDLMCNFKYPDSFKCLLYSSFIVLFLTIIKSYYPDKF